MRGLQKLPVIEIGDRPGHLEDPFVGSGAQPELLHGHLQQLLGILIDPAVAFDLGVGHTGVEGSHLSRKTPLLYGPGLFDPLPDYGGAFSLVAPHQLPVAQRRHFDVEVNAVQKRPGQAPLVLANILAPIILRLLGQGLGDLVSEAGVLALSGILDRQADEVEETVRTLGFSLLEKTQIADWVAFAFRKG